MRKNTLIKLLAVLAMCFVIGAAFVACGNNEDESAETAKAVTGVSFNSGKLVIAYDDGATESIDLPAPTTCTHPKELLSVEVEDHTATANGTYIDVCSDCGYAWIKYEQRHVWVEDKITVEATCTEGGYTIECYCLICGVYTEATDLVDPIDHVWNEGELVIDGNICEDGAVKNQVCIYGCGTTNTVVIAAAADEGIDGQHTVTAWDCTTNAPTLNAAGVATGVCEVCGETVTYDLPAILNADGTYNDAYTVTENSRTSCSQALTATVTLKADETIIYTDVVIIAAGGSHMLYSSVTGKLETVHAAKLDANNNPIDTYSTAEFQSIKGFADKPVASCTPILAYYYCEAENCDATVDVYAYSAHVYAETPDVESTVPADCLNPGTEYYTCTVCFAADSVKEVAIPALGHNKQYSDLVNDSGDEYNKFHYTESCTRCNYTLDVEVVDGVNGTVITSQEVTCVANGWVKVEYTIPEYNGVAAQDKEKTYTIIKLGHYLNGQQMNAVVNDEAPVEGEDTVYDAIEGIHAFDGKPFSSEYPVIGYFECDHEDADGHKHYVDVWVQLPVEP